MDKKIICDRCGEIVSGDNCYNVTEGYWEQFKRWEEELVCLKCMSSDPKVPKQVLPKY